LRNGLSPCLLKTDVPIKLVRGLGSMDMEILKVIAPYFISIMGAIVAIGIAIYTNSISGKR